MLLMERLLIDYSIGRRRQIAYVLLGVFHILLGGAALTMVLVNRYSILIVIVAALYTGLGVVFISGVLNKLHKYVKIDEETMIFKDAAAKHPIRLHWKDILSVTIYPHQIRVHEKERNVDIQLSVINFRDVRRVKDEIQKIAIKKEIPCVRFKTIRRLQEADPREIR